MNEFKEKLEDIKDSMADAISAEDSITININGQNADLVQEEPSQFANTNERNEKGHRKRAGKGLKNRLNSLVYENKAKDLQNQQLLALVQEQERKLAEINAKAEQNAHYTNVYYEQSLDNEKQRVLAELRLAEEEGDVDRKIALQDRLADINAQKQTQLLSKSLQKQQEQQNNNNYYQPPPPYNPPPPPPPIDDVNEDLEDFLDKRPFLNPNSHDYDPDISNEVGEFAGYLNKTLKVNGRSDLIGSREYYNIIDEEIDRRYRIGDPGVNDNQEQYDDDRGYANHNTFEVAPVSRKGSSMADRYVSNPQNSNMRGQNQRISLTPLEIRIAENMASTLTHFNGKSYTREEAIAEYAKQKARGEIKEI